MNRMQKDSTTSPIVEGASARLAGTLISGTGPASLREEWHCKRGSERVSERPLKFCDRLSIPSDPLGGPWGLFGDPLSDQLGDFRTSRVCCPYCCSSLGLWNATSHVFGREKGKETKENEEQTIGNEEKEQRKKKENVETREKEVETPPTPSTSTPRRNC